MKRIVLSLLLMFSLFSIAGCGNKKEINNIDDNNSTPKEESQNINDKTIIAIIDKTKEIDDFVCETALDPFYEDEHYTYSYGCIMSDYVVVKYSDGKEESVKQALKDNHISISDLDSFNVSYIRMEK